MIELLLRMITPWLRMQRQYNIYIIVTHLIRFWRNVLIGRCNSRFQLIGVRDLINNVYCIHIAYIRYSYYIRYSLYGSINTEVIMYRCKWRSHCLHPWLFFSVFPRLDFFLRSHLLYLPENNSLHSQLIILELIMSTDVYSCVDDYSNWNGCVQLCRWLQQLVSLCARKYLEILQLESISSVFSEFDFYFIYRCLFSFILLL